MPLNALQHIFAGANSSEFRFLLFIDGRLQFSLFPSVSQDVHARMSAFSFATEQKNSEDVSIVHARMSQLSLVTECVSPETECVQRYWNGLAMHDAVPAQHEPQLIHGGVPFALLRVLCTS